MIDARSGKVPTASDLAAEAFVGVVQPDLSPDLFAETCEREDVGGAISRWSPTAGASTTSVIEGPQRTSSLLSCRARRRDPRGSTSVRSHGSEGSERRQAPDQAKMMGPKSVRTRLPIRPEERANRLFSYGPCPRSKLSTTGKNWANASLRPHFRASSTQAVSAADLAHVSKRSIKPHLTNPVPRLLLRVSGGPELRQVRIACSGPNRAT